MKIKDAIERNLSLKTEYGAGGRVAGGVFNRRVFKRQNYTLDGARNEDVIHEYQWNLGPVCVTRRSHSPGLFDGEPHELGVSLFNLIGLYSNDRDVLVKAKTGINVGLFRTVLGLTPARAIATAADVDAAARAGLRLNVTRLLRDVRNSAQAGSAPEAAPGDEDIDLS